MLQFDHDGFIALYHALFGDGGGSSPVPTSIFKHVYYHPGSFIVGLTTTDNCGATDYDETTMEITEYIFNS